ncbi:GNAT family acetyltransferase [Psychromonas sp. CNPT3]|uniref:GNAT family N-acetyltransferase n=1 Tax=Psychromonas sp. CNPT3 TaxID=314282 RepID=UPI00006E580A|nr:GNAT family N-acetyltransferase [Psychromonas sp. CNPT3]AGH80422.1 GNAT family acetyltransferase [Psychromonas sp. CNPT3]
MITWHVLSFNELSTEQLYALMQLRVNVFVVEQACAYAELDGKDTMKGVYHLFAIENNEIIACARLLPAGISFKNVSIGRVAITKSERGKGIGHQLIEQALKQCERLWPGESIDIGAQEYLETFYRSYGFQCISSVYLEDDIAHIDMRLAK